MTWSYCCTSVAVTFLHNRRVVLVLGNAAAFFCCLLVPVSSAFAQDTIPPYLTQSSHSQFAFSQAETGDVVEGRFTIAHHDDFARQSYTRTYALLLPDGVRVNLDLNEEWLAGQGGATHLADKQVRATFAPVSAAEDAQSAENLLVALEVLPMQGDAAAADATFTSQTLRYRNLLCRFPDVAITPPEPHAIATWFDTRASTFPHYFDVVSNGAVQFDFSTAPAWHTLPFAFASFPHPMSARETEAMGAAVARACIELHGGEAALAGYDGVQFFTNGDWGSAFAMDYPIYNQNGELHWIRAAWYSYFWGNSYPHSIIAHELGHTLGAPHSNNSDGDANPYDNDWDVMSGDPCKAHVELPGIGASCLAQDFIAAQKLALGWLPQERIFVLAEGMEAIVDLDWLDANMPGGYSVVQIPTSQNGTAYFTVEARSAQSAGYDRALKATGVVIHETRPRRSQPTWQVGAASDAASSADGGLWEPGETYTNRVAGFSVTVVEALPTGYRLLLRRDAISALPPAQPPDIAVRILPTVHTWQMDGATPVFQLTNQGGSALDVTLQITLPVGLAIDAFAVAAADTTADTTAEPNVVPAELREVTDILINCSPTAHGGLCILPRMDAQTVIHLRPTLRATRPLASGRYAIQAQVAYWEMTPEAGKMGQTGVRIERGTAIPLCIGFCAPRNGATFFLPVMQGKP